MAAVAKEPETKVETKPEEAQAATRFPFRFRLLLGDHIDGKGRGYVPGQRDADGMFILDEAGNPVDTGKSGLQRKFHWKENPIIDTDVNLAKRYGSRKFKLESTHGVEAPPPREVDLEKLSVPQLVGMAEDEKIDLKGAAKKPEIIAAIKAARGK